MYRTKMCNSQTYTKDNIINSVEVCRFFFALAHLIQENTTSKKKIAAKYFSRALLAFLFNIININNKHKERKDFIRPKMNCFMFCAIDSTRHAADGSSIITFSPSLFIIVIERSATFIILRGTESHWNVFNIYVHCVVCVFVVKVVNWLKQIADNRSNGGNIYGYFYIRNQS